MDFNSLICKSTRKKKKINIMAPYKSKVEIFVETFVRTVKARMVKEEHRRRDLKRN